VVSLYTLAATIFSGALFPIDLLPGFLRPISYLLPQTFVLTSIRRLLMSDGDLLSGPPIGLSLIALCVGSVALYVIGLTAFGRSLEFGRRYGILGGY
jgi:ABC-2 type transport system permease protein